MGLSGTRYSCNKIHDTHSTIHRVIQDVCIVLRVSCIVASMRLQTFTNQPDFINAAVQVVLNACQKDGQVYIALSGGSTPKPVYEALANNLDIDFERVEWFVVDERYVPLDHEDSNYKMIMEAFGAAQPEFSEHFHFFNTSLLPEAAAREYEESLKKIPEHKFDLVLLGIGNDGHTASLFPHSSALHENERLAVDTINEPRPEAPVVRDRLTVTWPMILVSKKIVMLVSGEAKQSVVEELMNGSKASEDFPARRLHEHQAATVFYVM